MERPIDTATCLAMLLIDRGETEEAEPILRRCLEIRREALPEGHVLTAEANMLLGDILVRQEHYAEAEPLLVSACVTLDDSTAVATQRKREAHESVIALYEAWGKSAEMAEWRTRLLKKGY